MDQQIKFIEVSCDDVGFQRMIERLDEYQVGLYGRQMCNLDSVEVLRNSGAYLIGAYLNNELIGMGAVKLTEEYAEIKRMFVDQAFRGYHVAKRILELLETYAYLNGQETVCLETGILQLPAIALYERSGYRTVEKFGRYEPNTVSLYYRKDL